MKFTDGDLRHEAARQYAAALKAPDAFDVQDTMQNEVVPSSVPASEPETAGVVQRAGLFWNQLGPDDFHDASNTVDELLEDHVDLSRWAIDLTAFGLRKTTEMAWGYPTNWDLAVQIAHRPGVAPELHEAVVAAVRDAVTAALEARGIPRAQVAGPTTT